MPYKDPEKQRQYQLERYYRIRAEWFQENGPCIDCGTWGNEFNKLESDHTDASQKIDHRVWSWSKVRREKELAKCVVRCQFCHADKTTKSGEHARGESHYDCKLNKTQVLNIRAEYLNGSRVIDLAKRYNISRETIGDIVHGRSWKHI